MAKHLSLVESDFEHLEKRTLPRFPFCYMTFKCSENTAQTFEVKDISYSGMQVCLKNGEHKIKANEKIHGLIHWGAKEIEITGNVKWSTNMRMGVEFSTGNTARTSMDSFLDVASLAGFLKPVHKVDYGVELPVKLKYWLRADGPIEIFVWQHDHGELSKFQILIMENFVEWEDGKGIKSARVISKRDVDTPLINEDEIVFKFDEVVDQLKVKRAVALVDGISPEQLPQNITDFINLKIRS